MDLGLSKGAAAAEEPAAPPAAGCSASRLIQRDELSTTAVESGQKFKKPFGSSGVCVRIRVFCLSDLNVIFNSLFQFNGFIFEFQFILSFITILNVRVFLPSSQKCFQFYLFFKLSDDFSADCDFCVFVCIYMSVCVCVFYTPLGSQQRKRSDCVKQR